MAKSQKSPLLPIRYQPTGGMTSDLSPLAEQQRGNYGDAKNIHFLTQLGDTTVSIENCLGNTFSFQLPVVTTQNKIFRIYLEFPSPTPRILEFFSGNNVSLGTATYTPVASLAATYAAAIAAINTALGAGNISLGALVVTSTNAAGYFSLEFTGGTSINFWDYSITLTGAVDEPLPITTQEAVDASIAGMLRYIGSYDVKGDGLIWSTPQTELPEDIVIAALSNNGGLIRVTVADTTKILNNAAVKIFGSASANNANGTWIVTLISSTQFDLQGSVFASNTAPQGTVTVNSQGIGEIGVAVENQNDSTWNYITLARSTEWNFRTKKQVKTVCERNALSLNLYWTDNYNPYRRFYYQGAYMTNGGLNFVDPLNIYFYGDFFNQTRLFQGNSLADIKYFAQLQSGGGLEAGNYRYVIRFLDEFFNPTAWSDPSGIFVVSANTLEPNTLAVAEQVWGNPSYQQTSKINQIEVDGIIPNLFKYIELGALYYVDGTPVPVGSIVNRILLNQTTTQVISHTGLELDVRLLDINTLLSAPPDIATGLGIDIISNRLIPSNTRSHADIDFQSWVDTFQYNLLMDSISGVGSRFTGTLQVGEYAVSQNTFNYCGFMLNETYRISVKLELLNGAFTKNFWFDDIVFDTSGAGGKRLSGLPFMDLTDATAANVYVPHLQVVNIDWDFEIDGQPIKNTVKRIHWEFVEMTEQFQEILGSGAVAMGASFTDDGSGDFTIALESDYPCTTNLFSGFEASNNPTVQDITDNIFIEGAYIRTTIDEYGYGLGLYPLNTERKFMSFYTPNCLYGQTEISGLSGDQLIVFGASNIVSAAKVGGPSVSDAECIFNAIKEFSGFVNSVANTFYDISQVQNISRGSQAPFASLGGGRQYSKVNPTRSAYVFPFLPTTFIQSAIVYPGSPVLNTTADVTFQGVGIDYGFYLAQYYREKVNKFGDKANSKYIPTGSVTEYLGVDTMMYGDTFNQKSWIKHRQINEFDNSPALRDTCTTHVFDLYGFGGGIGFYSQNRVNTQMKQNDDSPTTAWQYPRIDEPHWLAPLELAEPVLRYNTGYSWLQSVTSDIAFDPNLPESATTPARFWWSLNKPENSIADLYTVILPLNFRDEDLTNGDIWHTIVANQELFTFQQRNVVRQYINDTAMIASSEAQVVFGDSGVAQQRGTQLSGYGTIHGFGVIKGKSAAGKDTFYYIDTYQCKVMRYEPSDGHKCLSDAHNMRWFFNNYLQFTNAALTPADGNGICGVWDDQNSEAIWTVRAKKDVLTFDPTVTYGLYDEVFCAPPFTLGYSGKTGVFADNAAITFGVNGTGFIGKDTTNDVTVYNLNVTIKVGDVVTDGVSSFAVTSVNRAFVTFEDTGEIFISGIAGNIGNLPYNNLDKWQDVPHFGSDDLINGEHPYNYYNEFTIAYNEVKDKFVTRYSWLPKLYIKIGKQFITPRPIGNENKAYTHYTRDSLYCVWYADGSDGAQEENAFIKGCIINYDVNLDKRAMAIEVMSLIAPFAMTFETKKYFTSLQESDFQARGDFFISSIKNNEVNGVDSGDSSRMFGSYISVSLTFATRINQNFFNFILKCLAKSRTWKT